MTGPTLRRSLLLGVAAPAGFLAVAAAGVVVTSSQPDATWSETNTPTTAHPAAALLAVHHCWTGDAPADMRDRIPGHVVVTLPGEDRPTYGGPWLTGRALDQVIGGAEHGLTVWGFCR
ncbi:hypothetical protein [Nocardioides sp. T2.26MG-1]|uniref:hypothetical protein n=1 Tax=Nocardioides sp. T2.26MG-1 TaxID=3041166 RepID=UPI0024774AE3|nr:hypothetical protein [Nocardioides sp. T2.26MG-1]CAI9417172.1 hypothetical protein HIDPHFAB_02954 [Nocardioides sp. T2.26MG-1]